MLVLDESLPHCSWPLGRVLEVYQNRVDGLVRRVKLKMRISVLVHVIGKTVLLEGADQS